MSEDLKMDDLNPCENVEPECQSEDSKPAGFRVRQKQEDQTDTDEWTDEEFGSAGDLAVLPDATSECLQEEADEKDKRRLQIVERDMGESAATGSEPSSTSGPPFDLLLLGQLSMSARAGGNDSDAVDGAVQLYQDFKPIDAMESVLARLAVGLTNATMDGLERAASPAQKPETRQVELRLSQKSAAAVIDVLTLLEKHRGSDRQKVSVGSVNVGSGGRAIVGNLQSSRKREEDSE